MNDTYLTALEAAKILSLSRPTLYKLARENKIETIKIGGNLVFSTSSIEEYASITIKDVDIPAILKPKKQINYWMIPRSVRKLVTLQEMIKDDYRNGIIGSQWKGTRTNHLKRDINLQNSGLRGKSPDDFVDSNPGGARTDVALLAALGFYAFDNEGNIELTYQGEQMLISTNPSSIITQQLFQFRYPSPYSKSINMNNEFEIFPYRFLFKLLLSDKLVDDGSIVADDNIPRITQNEIACFVISDAKKDTDIDKIAESILNNRKAKLPLKPTDTLKNIANTFINNIEITGFIERNRKSSSINIKESAFDSVFDLISTKPRNFKYEVGKENEFQHRLGMNPTKSKFTKTQTSNRTGGELAVQHLLTEELRNNPMTKEMITPELIFNLAQRAGTSIDIANKVVDFVLHDDPKDIFSHQYLEYSSSGRAFAREFEITTTKIFQEIFKNAKWTGKEGKSPDVTFNISPSIGGIKKTIVDCKAEKKYNISNDHFNRMTVEDTGYIPAYNADLFIYVANGFGTSFVRNLKKIETKCSIPGSGILAKDLLYLLQKHREKPFSHSQLLSLFTIGRVVTVGDINVLFNEER